MSWKKIFISALIIYVITLHIIIFLLYFDKVNYDEYTPPDVLPILSELETGLYAESITVVFDHSWDKEISVRKKLIAEFDLVDSVAILSSEYELFDSIIFSTKHNYFIGHSSETKFFSTRYLIRGNCLMLPHDRINEYTDSEEAAKMREGKKYSGCSFKSTDAPENVIVFEKDQKSLKLYYR